MRGKRPIGIWPLVGYKNGIRMQEANINLEVFNLETDFFGDLHCSSRFTDMLCDGKVQYHNYSVLEKCPMWGMWLKEEDN